MTKPLKIVAWLLPLAAVIVLVILRPFWLIPREGRPECPHDWTDLDTSFTNHLSIPGPITNVPEYHDCQRFLVNNGQGGLKYDSLEAIFVRYELDRFYRPSRRNRDFKEQSSANTLASGVYSKGFVVVGQVLSYGDYTPLGIKTGSNCLVLRWKTADNETTYEAWMVGVGQDGDRCAKEQPDQLIKDANRLQLDVALTHSVDLVPPVSRWDWDPKNLLQYIGIACPTGWCEIHAPGPFQSSPAYGESNYPITKGWYDEQYLATDVSGKLAHDDTTFGTIFPDPRLAEQTVATYTRKWQPVAWVAMRDNSLAYRNKLNFDAALPLRSPLQELANKQISDQLNEVELCFVPTGTTGCVAVGAPLPTNCTTDNTNHGTWYARETPPHASARASTISCTEFRYYPPPQAPAVVRWRWQKDDETMWISCPVGCCQVKVKS